MGFIFLGLISDRMEYMNIQPINDIIVPVGAVTLITHDISGKIKDITHVKNMVTTAGKSSMADHLRGETENNKGICTWHAVGTGTTAPALGDTDLETEIFRKLISVRSFSANVASFQTFFTASEANATLREIGLFGDDASSTPGSGTLFARLAVNRVKSASDTLTILHTLTIG